MMEMGVETDYLTRSWWAIALRGVAAVLFGLFALAAPGLTLGVLVLLFGAYALVDGVFAVASAIRHHRTRANYWTVIAEGTLGAAIGVATLLYPGITALALVYLIAGWALVTGVFRVAAAVRLRKEMAGEWMLALSGVISVVFAAYIAAFPATGALALVWVIGFYAVVLGAILVAFAFRLRGAQHRVRRGAVGV